MTDVADRIVRTYLRDIERATRDLPRSRRRELLAEMEAHIAEARAELPTGSEAEIRTMLERLGDPREIAAAERGRRDPDADRAVLEGMALALLLVGGVVVPVLGWLVGVVLLWISSRWTVGDKLLGTLVLPGGLLPLVALGVLAVNVSQPAGLLIVSVLAAAPIASVTYLGVRLRRARERHADLRADVGIA